MKKVIGVHLFQLKPEVTAEDFERFVAEEIHPAVNGPDIALRICRGERGERLGKYVMLFEFDDVAARNRYFPGTAEPTQAAKTMISAWWDRFTRYAEIMGVFTDYVTVGA